MKKFIAVFTMITLLFSFSLADVADAKPRGGFKSGPQTFKPPAKTQDSNIQKTTPAKNTGTTAGTTQNRGFFSGGLMGGLFAGLLLGGLLGSLGVFGDLLGLLLNIALIYVIFIAIRGIFRYFNKQRPAEDDRRRY